MERARKLIVHRLMDPELTPAVVTFLVTAVFVTTTVVVCDATQPPRDVRRRYVPAGSRMRYFPALSVTAERGTPSTSTCTPARAAPVSAAVTVPDTA